MVRAYILVKTHTGEADRIRDAIGDLDGVIEVHIVAGDVDLIAKVDVESPTDVKAIAADGIHGIDGVDTTQTYIAMD
ncbi:MAG: Lrp/AsnC family transcriptional regulator [Halobacteriales archaeon]